MNYQVARTLVVSGACVALLLLVWKQSRLGRLKLAYALGWAGLVGTGLLAPFLLMFSKPVAKWLMVAESTLLVLIASTFLLLITIQLSISVSGLSRQIEEISLRVAEVESAETKKAQSVSSEA